MSIGINRDLDRAMTRLLFDIGQRFSLGNQEATKGVAEVVDPNAPQSCLLQTPVEDAPPEVIRVKD